MFSLVASLLIAIPGLAQETTADAEPSAETAENTEATNDPPSSKPPEGIEIMRVTGRKVTALEADVPSSVTQFDAATISALGAQDASDLAKITPNVEIRTSGATAATFFIRGVGLQDFSANSTGAVAIYGDDVSYNLPALQLQGLYDLEDVQILRGPQGWGSGRNASAGAIKLVSRKPSGELGGYLRSSLGTYESDDARKGALIQTYEGAVETPIVEGVLASRFAFRLRDADPYIRNGCGGGPDARPVWPGFPVPKQDFVLCGEQQFVRNEPSPIPVGLPKYVGDQHSWSVRGQFLFEPPETQTSWLLNMHGSRLDQQSTLGQASGTGNSGRFMGSTTNTGYTEPDQLAERQDIQAEQGLSSSQALGVLGAILTKKRPLDRAPYRGDYDRVGQTKLDTWGGFLRGDIEIGEVNLKTVTGYDGYDRSRDTDTDFTPDVLFETIFHDKAWQVVQELTVTGDLADRSLRWEVGGGYQQERLEVDNLFLVPAPDITTITREYTQDTYAFQLWAGFQLDFLDDFTLEAGGRYNWERKEFSIDEIDVQDALSSGDSHKTWTAPTGSISLTYRFTDTASVYYKYSRGFKAGHYNSNSVDEPPARPETLDSFETGFKGAWFDTRLSLGGSFFYYKYNDYQVFVFENSPGPNPPTLEIINANNAEVYGIEADLELRPLQDTFEWLPDEADDLLIQVRFGWLKSEFLDFTDTEIRSTGTRFFPVTFDFTGNELINSPEFKISGTAEWPFDLGYWGTLTPRYDFAWTDDIYFNQIEGRGSADADGQPKLPQFAVGQQAFVLHNLMLTYETPEGNIEISGWVRNLLDQRYKTYGFDASQFSKVVVQFVGEPRTVGVDLTLRW